MKRLFFIVCVALMAVALFGSSATAVEDLGEQSVFASACRSIIEVGRASGLEVRTCRRRAPDEIISPYQARVHVVVIAADGTKFNLDIVMNKSLWQVAAFEQLG